VILDWFANPDHAPLFVAQQQGYFKQQGLAVKLIGPADPADPPKLVAVGKADLAVTYQPQLYLQAQQGLPLVRIATLISSPLNCLAVNANSNIIKLSDLKGKSIGYSAGGIDSAMVHAMLIKDHVSLNDVKLIDVNYDLTQALITGKVDAVTGIMRNFELIQMRLAGFHPRAFYPENYGVPPYDELIIVANTQELTDPRIPKFLSALKAGEDYLQRHPQQSWDLFVKNHPELNNELNKEAWFATLPVFAKNPAALDVKRYQNFAQFMQAQGLISKVLPVSHYAVQIN
jgi:putative hydroxymethylpyrimidine transport system substrate-binding protein